MKRILTCISALCLIVIMTPKLSNAQSDTLRDIKDAYICDCDPRATNPGGDINSLYQGPYSHCYARTLMFWDISGISKEKTITNVLMKLRCYNISGSLSGKMVFYRLTKNWDQSKVSYSTRPTYTTQDSVVADWPKVGETMSVDVTKFVKYWIDHPEANFGILGHCSGTTSNTGVVVYYSSRYRKVESRPTLIVNYVTTDVKAQGSLIPSKFNLNTYPNPFNPTMNISYSLEKPSWVTLKVFDIHGKEVEQITGEYLQAGEHRTVWNAKSFTSGVYFVALNAGKNRAVKKVVLLK